MSELLFALKFVGLALLIFQCGRFALLWLMRDDIRGLRLSRGEYSYVAISAGVAVTFLWAIILRTVHAYSWPAMLVGIALTGVLTAIGSRHLWRRTFPERRMSWFGAYGVTVLTVLLCVAPETYPNQRGTATYLLQGFDLFADKDASVWPYFGEQVTMPIMYVTHVIGTVSNLFSYRSPYRFYLDGLYWGNVLLAPLVPIGAYLFFRRKLHWIAAALASATFCWMILGGRTWSIRGETLGWLFGFAFLIGFAALIEQVARPEPRAGWRTAVCLAVLYFTVALTHGISAFVSTAIAAGLVSYVLAQTTQRKQVVRYLATTAGIFVATALVVTVAYLHAFRTPDRTGTAVTASSNPPLDPERDAAVMFENAILYPGRTIAPTTRRTAPYLPPATAAQLTAFIPVAALFRPEVEDVALANFPANALADLRSISLPERATYVLALAFGIAMLWWRRGRWSDDTAQWVFVALWVYMASIALTLYFNAQSTSVFPLAATRRLYQYVRFSFCVAVLVSVFEWVVRPLVRPVLARFPLRRALSRPAIATIALGLLLPGAILYSISETSKYALVRGGWLHGLAQRQAMFQAVQHGDADVMKAPVPPVHWNPVLSLPNLFAAVEAVKARTREGEYVYVNIISDNQFWYLSHGRISLLEGSAMYQVYGLQGPAAARIDRFRQFAASGDLALLGEQQVRFVLLYKHDGCYTPACYGFASVPARLDAFRHNPNYSVLLENDEFVLLRIEHPVPSIAPNHSLPSS